MFTLVEYITLGTIAALLVWLIVFEVRLHRLTRGSKGKSLEAHIARIGKENTEIQDALTAVQETLKQHNTRLSNSIRGIGLEKFNPFAGNGTSKPSFALALLDERGNGIVLSTLHTRDTVSIFTKTILSFKAEKELSTEEAAALEKAKKAL